MNRLLTIRGLILMTGTAFLFASSAVAAEPGIVELHDRLDAYKDGMVTQIEVDGRPDLVRTMHLYSYGSSVIADVNEDGNSSIKDVQVLVNEVLIKR